MPDAPGIKFEREEDFTTLYANNTQFEASAWDLKIIFGQLDQSKADALIQQHTAMTLSWTHAKLMAYFLLVNVIAQQARTGFISVPPAVIWHGSTTSSLARTHSFPSHQKQPQNQERKALAKRWFAISSQ